MRYRSILIDGRHLLYRAADAMRDLGVGSGEDNWTPTGAMYGFIKTTLGIWDRLAEDGAWLCVCWEGGRLYRRAMYDGYKRKEEPADEATRDFLREMNQQEELLKVLLSRAGWSQAVADGFEADDVLGTLAKHLTKSANQKPVAIYTGDSDLHQCVTPEVHVVSPNHDKKARDRDRVWALAEVNERWAVGPERIPQFKALAGDSSDRIPGIKGIGEGWAKKLLTAYPTLEALEAAAEAGPLAGTFNDKAWSSPRMSELVKVDSDNMWLSLKLATIVDNAPVRFLPTHTDHSKVVEVLQAFRMHSLLRPSALEQIKSIGDYAG